jgi:hypothetical protein
MALGWLKVSTGLALTVIVGFVMVHPDVDLLEGIFHQGHDMDQDLRSAIPVVLDEPSAVSATAPLDTTPLFTVLRPDSLDLLCVRLC